MLAARWLLGTIALAAVFSLPAEAEMATFVNRKTGETVTGDLKGSVTKEGKTVYCVRTEDGKWLDLLRSEWDKKKTDESSAEGEAEIPKKGGASVDVDFTGRKKSSPAETVREVVATGVAADPDKATQAAFSNAIEQVVGLLVDAETIVKNDQLVKDQILTFSRGFVQKFDVVKQWQEDGLHHATIKASVETGKLTDRLHANKIATHGIPGERVAHQFEFDFENEEQAATMLQKILAGFDMKKLARVEIIGKPEMARQGANAEIKIRARVSPDMAQWGEFSRDLRRLLEKTATKRAGLVRSESSLGIVRGEILQKQLRGPGILVCLFGNTNIRGDRSQWEVFRVPDAIEGAIKEAAGRMGYRLAFQLFSNEGREILKTSETISADGYSRPAATIHRASAYPLGQIWWIGPVWWENTQHPFLDVLSTVVLSHEDLGKVAKVGVSIEQITGQH